MSSQRSRFPNPAMISTSELSTMTPSQKREYLAYLQQLEAEAEADTGSSSPADEPGRDPLAWCGPCVQELLMKRRKQILESQRRIDAQELERMLEEERRRIEDEIRRQHDDKARLRAEMEEDRARRADAQRSARDREAEEDRARINRLRSEQAELEARQDEEERARREAWQKEIADAIAETASRRAREKAEEDAANSRDRGLSFQGLYLTPEEIAENRRRIREELEEQIRQGKVRQMSERDKQIEEDRRVAERNRQLQEEADEEARLEAERRKRDTREAYEADIAAKKKREDEERQRDKEEYLRFLEEHRRELEEEAERDAALKRALRDAYGMSLDDHMKDAELNRAIEKFLQNEAARRLLKDKMRSHGDKCPCSFCGRCGTLVETATLTQISAEEAALV